MIEVDEILVDFDLCSNFAILRTPGTFQLGGWVRGSTTTIPTMGATRNTSGKELEMVSEADRVKELLTFRTVAAMYPTDASVNQTSDILVYHSYNYRILAVKYYDEQGYYLAVATRMVGN